MADMLLSDALISECGTYRYWLRRLWDESLPCCAFIMLNPSTADASNDDPTIRRCIGFAKMWGYGGLNVYNLFALRATDPRELRKSSDPIGPDNDAHLSQIPQDAMIVAAWGSWGDYLHRAFDVHKQFKGRLWCLGLTKGGHPRHPLYVPANQERLEYPFPEF